MIAKSDLFQALRTVEELSNTLHTTSWIWGGMTADIYQGCLLREHHDLDYLTLDLHDLVEPFSRLFERNGWRTDTLINGDLQIEKDDVEIQLGHISVSAETRWTHNGDMGSLYFPPDWLPQESIRFLDVEVHVIAPELQFVLLTHPDLLNPKWIHRAKDIAALSCLKTILESRQIKISGLETKVHS